MLTTILLILALVFAILGLCNVPRVNWCCAGLLCLALAGLIGSGLIR